ncbi:MAG: histidinol-phosphate aminotransferase family protein [Lachnospiraceae bacterium]|nr:histidinol-phosphate aminotransferase family protein [Lachnospiraceae bacterium]
MSGVNPYLSHIKPYKVASHKIWSVEPEERSGILKLDWNEATVPPAPGVKKAVQALLAQDDFFHLYPSTVNDSLMARLCDYTGLPQENILYFSGSDALQEVLVRVWLHEGSRVLLIWPSYDNFRLTAESTGAALSYLELGKDFVYEPEKVARTIEETKTEFVYLCNPNNPSGTLIPAEEIEALLERFPDTVFLVDEAYGEFAETTAAPLVLRYENLLISRTLSKAFALANIRFGYMLASEKNIEAVAKIRNPKNISTITQAAAEAALADVDYMKDYVREVQEAREYLISSINESPLREWVYAYESRANFVLLRFADAGSCSRMQAAWEAENIFVRLVRQSPSLENCLRISIGKKSQMERVLSVMRLAFL